MKLIKVEFINSRACFCLQIYRMYSEYSLGGSMTLPIVPEVWRGDTCGSNGRVQVKCTKINGKCLKI